MEKRGVAEVIVVILIILLVIAAFVMVWNVVLFLIKTKAADISIEGLLVEGELEYYLPNEFAVIKVTRGNENEKINGVRIDFSENSGASYYYNTSDYPAPMETKRYVIFMNQLNPDPTLVDSNWNFGLITSIALRYLFPSGKTSMELDKETVNHIKNSSDKLLCLYTDADGDGYGTGDVCTDYASAQPGKSPVNGDCNDASSAVNICSGSTPYCDSVSKTCKENKNYEIQESNINSFWISDSDCNWQIINLPQQISLPWNFQFYKDSINLGTQITMCKQGHLAIDGNCYTINLDPTSYDLKIRKIIAPYMIKTLGSSSQGEYCLKENYIAFRWTKSSVKSEVILYSNGEIRYSYNTATQAKIGVSYGDQIYYTEKTGTSIDKDYKLTF